MATAVYLGAEATHRVRTAQAVVDEHAIDAATERCVQCTAPGPCETRREALAVLDSYGRLPRRRRGATRPEAIIAAGVAPSPANSPSFAWLGPATERPVVGRHRRPDL